jgi:hypothetical protein
MKMKIRTIATLLIISLAGACGGGGGSDSSDENITTDIPSFGGTYEGSLNRISHKNDCSDKQPTFYDVFAVTHNAGDESLTIQYRSDAFSKNHPGTVTSADSFIVEMETKQVGVRKECTSQTTFTFEDINESSALVRTTEQRVGTDNCFSFDFSQKPSGSCTRIYEAVLTRK